MNLLKVLEIIFFKRGWVCLENVAGFFEDGEGIYFGGSEVYRVGYVVYFFGIVR